MAGRIAPHPGMNGNSTDPSGVDRRDEPKLGAVDDGAYVIVDERHSLLSVRGAGLAQVVDADDITARWAESDTLLYAGQIVSLLPWTMASGPLSPQPAETAATVTVFEMAPKLATAERVDRAAMLEFIRPRHKMVLTTFRSDGSLQSSPVTGGVDGQGRLVVSSYPQRAKCVNIRRNPAVSVLVLSNDFNGAYVQVDGNAEIVDLPDAVKFLVDYYRVIAGEHPDWGQYRRAMVEQGKCLIRITPLRWGPMATGGFPPR